MNHAFSFFPLFLDSRRSVKHAIYRQLDLPTDQATKAKLVVRKANVRKVQKPNLKRAVEKRTTGQKRTLRKSSWQLVYFMIIFK